MVEFVPASIWQHELDAYYEEENRNFTESVAFGIRVTDNLTWQSSIQTIHDALEALDTLHQRNHQGVSEGGYHYKRTGDYSATVICETQYPSDFDYGILYGIILKFRDETSSQIVVRRDYEQNSNARIYHLAW